ncbi:Xanthine/uracil/vitamin C permease [Artemisia annua]|uniref:Xanthine/uracil/vitamin C permease n=1 Tax=Artemisia annua TaxID=35608 RepID=A0A2U1MJP3_ARTAN|nr:Xanthine/uracil/vitamin C permease [Artemisia annua]
MVENGHHHPPVMPPPMTIHQPLGAARGPAFPPAEQLLQLNYCIHSNPSWAQTVFLGFQHYIVMLGSVVMIATKLVPTMGGSHGDKARVIQAVLFTSGLNTLLQTLIGSRLPTVMGPSFAYLLSVLTIIEDLMDEDFRSEREKQPEKLVMVENGHHHPPVMAPPMAIHQPLAQTVFLGFQHYIVMLGSVVMIATKLVPTMGGSHGDKARVIQAVLFTSGLNTLLQTLIGSRLPTVMGPSFAYLLSVLTIIEDLMDEDFRSERERFHHTMRAIQGSLIISSFINMILGFSRAWGDFTKLFSPVVIVAYVSITGLGLFGRGFPQLAKCVEIGLPMLIFLVVLQQYMKRLHHRAHPILERFGLLFCIALVWAFAALLTVAGAYNNVGAATKQSCRTDRSYLMETAPWIRMSYPFQWGAPIFRASHVFGMMGAALVSTSTGTFFAASRFAGATPPPGHVLSRSIGFQGIGQLLDGTFGSIVGNAASVENVGLLGLTHVGSRRVVQVSAAFMLFFSIFGKFGAFFASIPLPIFAAIYCVLYGLFNSILNTIFSSPPTVAMIVGTILDNTLDAHDARDDRGVGWWHPFQHRKGDSRNEEFYSFPLRINEYMPRRSLCLALHVYSFTSETTHGFNDANTQHAYNTNMLASAILSICESGGLVLFPSAKASPVYDGMTLNSKVAYFFKKK